MADPSTDERYVRCDLIYLLGTIKRDAQIRSDTKRKEQSKSSTIAKTRAPDHLTPEPQGQTTTRPTPWASDADTVSSDPLGLGRKFRLARPPEARTQIPSRPTPQRLGRRHCLARPLPASGASSVSPDPSRARASNDACPDQGKASDARRPYSRRDRRSNFRITAGHGGNYSNHPGHCGLTSFTMQPYLFYCGVLPHSKRGMGKVNQRHCLLSSPTFNRTISSITDPTPMTPTGLGNPLQEKPCCQPSLKDEMDQLPQGRDCGFTIQQRKSTHVNTCLPLRL